ncbi:MAG: site-specific integrase, partial [Rhizobiales bacterium]|nr:site-specific integrase [Hyphomicrobiales bacterium]
MNPSPNEKPYSIYQQKNSKKWWVRFSIEKQGQQRVALGTYDRQEAEELAKEKLLEAKFLARHGLSVTRKPFSVVAEKFIAQLKEQGEAGEIDEYQFRQYAPIIRRYFIGYFANKLIATITPSDIESYWDFRISYWTKGPGKSEKNIVYTRTSEHNGAKRSIKISRPVKEGLPSKSTLSKELMLLRKIFQYALRYKYTLNVPETKLPRTKKLKITNKPGFTLEEFLHVEKISLSRIEACDKGEEFTNLNLKRRKLHCYVMIAGYTGMRATELRNMIWGDIGYLEEGTIAGYKFKDVVIQVRGKAKEREMVAQQGIRTEFARMRELFHCEIGRFPTNQDPVFCHVSGKPIASFKIGLAKLLDAADLRTTPDGRMRDSGSFRSFYITQQLRQGVSPIELISNT